jgi:hypothetical protein
MSQRVDHDKGANMLRDTIEIYSDKGSLRLACCADGSLSLGVSTDTDPERCSYTSITLSQRMRELLFDGEGAEMALGAEVYRAT